MDIINFMISDPMTVTEHYLVPAILGLYIWVG